LKEDLYHAHNQIPSEPSINLDNRLTLDEITGSKMKINLIKKDGELYDEVGIYTTELQAELINYPAVIRTYVIVIHVLHPCKNVIDRHKIAHFRYIEDSDEAYRIPD
jgi:hypothetical protein